MASTQIPLIASPLYILRDHAAQDLNAVLAKLAELGFDGVELLGFFGHTPADIRRTLDGLGLKALGNHVPWADLSARPEDVLADHQTLGCGYLTVAGLSALDALPLEALAQDSAGLYVFVIRGSRAYKTAVKVGELDETSAEITSGVKSGDVVALNPGDLRHRQKVYAR